MAIEKGGLYHPPFMGKRWKNDGKMARPERFELPTNWFEANYSIQLSYGRILGRALYSSFGSNSKLIYLIMENDFFSNWVE